MWMEVFRAGKHTDSAGRTKVFTDGYIRHIASKYNEKVGSDSSLMAPMVKGHPADDAPAYGWVDKLKAEGGRLYADVTGIEQSMYQDIKNGRYRNISIALSGEGELVHVGVLGAASPAVKGMQPLRFISEDNTEDSEKGVSTFISINNFDKKGGDDEIFEKDEIISNNNYNSSDNKNDYGDEEVDNIAIGKMKTERELLREELNQLRYSIAHEKRLTYVSSEINKMDINNSEVDLDRLIANLAKIDDDDTSDNIIEILANIVESKSKEISERENGLKNNYRENSEKINSSKPSEAQRFAANLGREYNLGIPKDIDLTNREILDAAVKSDMINSPNTSYESALEKLIMNGNK